MRWSSRLWLRAISCRLPRSMQSARRFTRPTASTIWICRSGLRRRKSLSHGLLDVGRDGFDGEAAGARGGAKVGVVALDLVGVGDGVVGDGIIKNVVCSKIARQRRGVAGFGVGTSEGAAAEMSVRGER